MCRICFLSKIWIKSRIPEDVSSMLLRILENYKENLYYRTGYEGFVFQNSENGGSLSFRINVRGNIFILLGNRSNIFYEN
jgi:hypothetical protein